MQNSHTNSNSIQHTSNKTKSSTSPNSTKNSSPQKIIPTESTPTRANPIAFLPISRSDMDKRGWDQLDILLISADAYVDHPSFAAALLGRMLESHGYRVGIIAQPDWKKSDSLTIMGQPRLCVMISGGNLDSMVAHYTSSKKRRSTDQYSPGGKIGLRPDRATIVYSNLARQAFGHIPIIIGGIESSLRRLAHYDYWQDLVRKPILLDAKADLLVYGMGELQTLEIARRLAAGETIKTLHDIPGTCYALPISALKTNQLTTQTQAAPAAESVVISSPSAITPNSISNYTTSASTFTSSPDSSFSLNPSLFAPYTPILLPSFEEVSLRDKKSNTPDPASQKAYAKAFNIQLTHENPFQKQCLIQPCNGKIIVQNPPARPLTEAEFDSLYELPYQRRWHPIYDKLGGVPGLQEVQFSITSNRGCFGGCSFCAITNHQGRIIQTRSTASLVREATLLTHHPDFKGYIHDLGGPTANFQGPACSKQLSVGPCANRQCLFPTPCPNITDSHRLYLAKLDAVASVPGVKKVFIRSGLRFDYLTLCADKPTQQLFLQKLVSNHISGQLKVAPEHICNNVLHCMGKSPVAVYDAFRVAYSAENKRQHKKQFIIPYLIAAHPGSTLDDAIQLALYMKNQHFVPDQVQEFYPTPSTVSTCMYYTGLDPRPGQNFKSIYIPKGRDAHLQRALLQFNKPQNRSLVLQALQKANRLDLASTLLPNKPID